MGFLTAKDMEDFENQTLAKTYSCLFMAALISDLAFYQIMSVLIVKIQKLSGVI